MLPKHRVVVVVLISMLVLVGCGAAQPAAAPEDAPAAAAREVVMAMPFIPSVQFAHYYVAHHNGYYRDAGLDVQFDYNYETDVIQRVAQGTVDFGQGSGDSVLLARGQGLPILTIATMSQRFPVVFFSKAAQGIDTPDELRGATVGIPGRFGASYIGLLALLDANGINEGELDIQEIGFAQVAAISQERVQVAAGYANNEPIQLSEQGIPVNVIRVSDSIPLASDGMITSENLAAEQPELVRAFVQATLRGMQDVVDDPEGAFEISLAYVEELRNADAATQQLQRRVLAETITFWQSDSTARAGLGFTDLASWQATETFLRNRNLLTTPLDLEDAFTNQFVGE